MTKQFKEGENIEVDFVAPSSNGKLPRHESQHYLVTKVLRRAEKMQFLKKMDEPESAQLRVVKTHEIKFARQEKFNRHNFPVFEDELLHMHVEDILMKSQRQKDVGMTNFEGKINGYTSFADIIKKVKVIKKKDAFQDYQMGSDLFGRGRAPSSFLMSDIGETDYDPLDTSPLLRFSPRK
jgi:hypothetical protein